MIYNIDKNWDTLDNKGEFRQVDKSILLIDESYQRTVSVDKIKRMSANWSWVNCGCIVVANRNGKLFVIDGQHRLIAAKKRDDIRELPCIVFNTETNVCEAKAFYSTNTERNHMNFFYKFKALVVSGDENANYCKDLLEKFDMQVSQYSNNRTKTSHFLSIGWLLGKALTDRDRLEEVLSIAYNLSTPENQSIPKIILEGLWALDSRYGVKLEDKFTKRLYNAGFTTVFTTIKKLIAIEGAGNTYVYAAGILKVVNKGLKNKYKMSGIG